jgi:hypothetical protein
MIFSAKRDEKLKTPGYIRGREAREKERDLVSVSDEPFRCHGIFKIKIGFFWSSVLERKFFSPRVRYFR